MTRKASRRPGRANAVMTAGIVAVAIVAACGDGGDVGTPPLADAAPDAPAVDALGDAPALSAFGLDVRPANPTCLAPSRPTAVSPVRFERVFQSLGLTEVATLTQRPGDGSRWYATTRTGAIVSFPSSGSGPVTPVGDLNVLGGSTVTSVSEGGFLGFAWHPNTAANGRAYVWWTNDDLEAQIGYLTSADGGQTFSQYKSLLSFLRPSVHCGGGLAFGNDGFLYASFGDAGSTFRAQNRNEYYSKLIRIDVDTPPVPPATFVIPDGNPFKDGGGEPATYAWGFRNPFRFSFDRATGDLWLADVGQEKWEEIDLIKQGGNYGWPCREGAHDFQPTSVDPVECPSMLGLVDPVAEIEHVPVAAPRAITGGVVYRGKAIPSLVGAYLFADSSSREIFSLTFEPVTGAPVTKVLNTDASVDGVWVWFAEDQDGEVYVVGFDGPIYKLVPAGPPSPSTFPDRLSKTGCFDPSDPKKPASGLVPFRVNAALWSDGAEKERFLALPDGKTIAVKDDGDFDLPAGSVVVKTFAIGGKRIETRLLVRHDDGDWAGYSYEWNDAQTDATLLPSAKTKRVGAQAWIFPSRADCMKCHTAGAGRTLGLELGQLNGDHVYPATNRVANQLATLDHVGMFDKKLGKPANELARLPDPFGTSDGVEVRARAYLHTNCAQCHRPANPMRTSFDLRFSTPLRETKICNASPVVSDMGLPNAKLLTPGSPATSLLALRMRATNVDRMPPLATRVVDPAGAGLVDDFVRGVAACP